MIFLCLRYILYNHALMKGNMHMFLICLLLWFLFNGRVTVEILVFGAVISAVIYAVSCRFLGFSLQKDLFYIKKLPVACMLLGVLLSEIVKSNLAVIRAVYSNTPQDSRYEEFDTSLEKTITRVALADCITLTPGTITGRLDGNHYIVHCLNQEMAEGLGPEQRRFTRQLQKLEEREETP